MGSEPAAQCSRHLAMTTALDAGPATTNESTMDGRRFQLRFSVQAFVWLLVTILALATIALNFGDLKASIQVLKGAQLGYLPVLALLEALFLLNMGLFYTATFRASNVHASAPRFVLVSAGAHFVNLVSKSSGFGGLALYLNEGRCHGDSSANVTGAYVAAYVLSYAGFLVTLILALALLQLRGSLTLVEKASSGVLFLIVITIVAASVAGLRNRRSLAQVCRRLTAIPNWAGKQFLRRPLFATEQVEAWAEELYDSFRLMRTRPAAFITPFMHALGIELLAASSLYFLGLALNTGMSLDRKSVV